MTDNYKTVDPFADGCSGQNRNSIVASMLLFAMINLEHIEQITLRFFEPHHGQSEGDSAHSAITNAIERAGDIFIPGHISTTVKFARRNKPYIVNEMSHQDFRDFKQLSKNI